MGPMRLVAPIAVLAALSACSSTPGRAEAAREADYPVPIEAAQRMLAAAERPPMVFGDGPVDFRLVKQESGRLVWSVSRGSSEIMRYTAELEPAGEGATKVTLAMRGSGNVEARLAKSESIRTLYLVAMRERITADLEGRPYDMSNIVPAMTAATAANLDLFRPPPDHSRQNMKQAYRDELEAGRNY